MDFYPGFKIIPQSQPIGFTYGEGVFGPVPEIRRLDDIRASLADPSCSGPEELYAISMDVGREEDRKKIEKRGLLYGAVAYGAGIIGREPVRSQGHITQSAHPADIRPRRSMRSGTARPSSICRKRRGTIRVFAMRYAGRPET